ncbi:hypothetical protein DYH09_28910 [bacterium CPR1]|nr:hypothetical protein [bacterium CPR1]
MQTRQHDPGAAGGILTAHSPTDLQGPDLATLVGLAQADAARQRRISALELAKLFGHPLGRGVGGERGVGALLQVELELVHQSSSVAPADVEALFLQVDQDLAVFDQPVLVTQVEGKVISDYQAHIGNPADVTMAVGVVERHIDQFGNAPDEFAADRGYHSAGNETGLEKKGVKRVSIPARGKLSNKREEHQKQSWFRRLQRFRAGSEGSISFLKRCFGWRRSRLKGLEGTAIFTGFGVFSHNLLQAHHLTADRQARARRRAQAGGGRSSENPGATRARNTRRMVAA